MTVNRHPRPRRQKRKKSLPMILPFFVQNVKRNEDVFRFIFDKRTLIAEININIDRVSEEIDKPMLRIILETGTTVITVRESIKQGMNNIQFNHFAHKDSVLRFDFDSIDSLYQKVRGITGSIAVRI